MRSESKHRRLSFFSRPASSAVGLEPPLVIAGGGYDVGGERSPIPGEPGCVILNPASEEQPVSNSRRHSREIHPSQQLRRMKLESISHVITIRYIGVCPRRYNPAAGLPAPGRFSTAGLRIADVAPGSPRCVRLKPDLTALVQCKVVAVR